MKKLLIILIGILMIPNAFTVTTYPRTKDNLRVRKEIAVNKNIDNILNTPSVNPSEKVYDFANVFNNEKIVSIKERVDAFRSKNNYDLVIVTTSDNKKENTINYADDFYWYNDFGISKSRNGVVIVLDLKYRRGYVSTYGNVKADNYDVKISSHEIKREIKEGKYFDATMHLIDLVDKSINDGLGDLDTKSTFGIASESFVTYLPIVIFISLTITTFIIIVMITKNDIKSRKNNFNKMIVKDTLKIYNKKN